jgi:UDP-4-amino-4,6-dideoxy-N-acetyl-beta-L-altrosamine transaminase
MSRALKTTDRAAIAPEALPYGRHWIDEADVAAVVEALRSDRLAHGPRVGEFEAAVALTVGASAAAAASSGTAALHLALAALGVGEGDVCIVPAITFLATATAARFCGAEVVFADVDPATGLMTAETLRDAFDRAEGRVRAVLPVHLGGRLCNMDALAAAARARDAAIVEDACHALGGIDAEGRAVGGCAVSDAACFSFHPVKTIAAGEGGMVTTNDPARAERMRRLANHGVTKDPSLVRTPDLSLDPDGAMNPWAYEQIELGFNYRMDELGAALGLSQLRRLERFVRRRRELAGLYEIMLAPLASAVTPIAPRAGDRPALHLYQVLIDFEGAGVSRAQAMRRLADEGVGTQVHYIPVYRQPYFEGRYGRQRLPGAEAFYDRVLALPLFPAMRNEDVERVVEALGRAIEIG